MYNSFFVIQYSSQKFALKKNLILVLIQVCQKEGAKQVNS